MDLTTHTNWNGRLLALLLVAGTALLLAGCPTNMAPTDGNGPPNDQIDDGGGGGDDGGGDDGGDGGGDDGGSDGGGGGGGDSGQGGYDANGDFDITEAEIDAIYAQPLTHTQELVTALAFDALVAGDAGLAEIVAWAQSDHNAGDLILVGRLGDQNGVELYIAIYENTAGGEDVYVVHRCEGGDCVSAVLILLDTDEEMRWATPTGDITPQGLAEPFLLRTFDESDPDGTAQGAPVPAGFQTAPTKPIMKAVRAGANDKLGTIALEGDGVREVRVLSAFGDFWGTDYSDFVSAMTSQGFDQGSFSDHADKDDFDNAFGELGPDDALVIQAHGDASESQDRVVGMSANWGYFWGEHYSEDRMLNRMDLNSDGGPGLIFFGGCRTSEIIGKLDKPNRIVLGFSDNIKAGHVKPVVQYFFQKFAKEGLTLGEALDAVNDKFKTTDWRVRVNSRADLRIKFTELGDFDRDGCRDTCQFANDGSCDDGGPSSESGACDFGTDCSDCGPRHEEDLDNTAKATVTSTFDTGKEGWRIVGDAEGGRGVPDYQTGGGQDGPFVSADDDVQGGTWYWLAPEAYMGNFSNAYGQSLTFFLQQSSKTSQFSNSDLVLVGGGITLVYTFSDSPGETWTFYDVQLTESGWTNLGSPATEADMKAVLADITELQIRGEYRSGGDTGGLDTVTLNTSP